MTIFSHEVHEFARIFSYTTNLRELCLLCGELKNVIQNERALARVDDLTGIFNRRKFYDRACLELILAERYERPFSLAYFGLDLFKKVSCLYEKRTDAHFKASVLLIGASSASEQLPLQKQSVVCYWEASANSTRRTTRKLPPWLLPRGPHRRTR